MSDASPPSPLSPENGDPTEAQMAEALDALLNQHEGLHRPENPETLEPKADEDPAPPQPQNNEAISWLNQLESGVNAALGDAPPKQLPKDILQKALSHLESLSNDKAVSELDLADLQAIPLLKDPDIAQLAQEDPLEAHWYSIHRQLQNLDWEEARNQWVKQFPQLAPHTQRVVQHIQQRINTNHTLAQKLSERGNKDYAIYEALRDLGLLASIRGTTPAPQTPPSIDAQAGKHKVTHHPATSMSQMADRLRTMPQSEFNRLSDQALDRFLRQTIRD